MQREPKYSLAVKATSSYKKKLWDQFFAVAKHDIGARYGAVP